MARRRNYGIKRTFRRGAKMVGRAIKRRYVRKGKGSTFSRMKFGQMAKDLAVIQRSLNSERKFKDAAWATTQSVAAVDFNSAGHSYWEFTTSSIFPTQGDGYSERVGSQIKLTGAEVNFKFLQQSATATNAKIRIELYQVVGDPETIDTTLMGKLYDNATLGGIINMESRRNIAYKRLFKRVACKYVYITQDPHSGTVQHKNVQFRFRFNDKIRWVGDGTTLSQGQMFFLLTCDVGNKNAGSASSVSGNQYGAVSTGYTYDCFGRIWYSDT